MKNKFTIFCFFLFFCVTLVSSQVVEIIHPPKTNNSLTFVNHNSQKIQNSNAPALLNPLALVAQKKWDISLSQHGINHGSQIAQNRVDSIKQAGTILMRNRDLLMQGHVEAERTDNSLLATPFVNKSFKGNTYNGWAPPDNNLAVSDDGYIVSVDNTNILFADQNGNILMEQNMEDYLSFLHLSGGFFDPKVIHDPTQNKFILVVLNGNTPATSQVVIAFSTTSNPMDNWWVYTFTGDPNNQNLWLDFPSIGISTDDIYVSGNQFTADRNFSQVMIYQFEKGSGFAGGNVTGVNFHDVRDAYGAFAYTVVPMSFGFDGSIGPGIYFISTVGEGGTEAMMYFTDANSQNNPTLQVFNAAIPNYYMPFDGSMLGTNDQIKTNDCRTLTGFYADGTIHFAFNTRGDDFHTKIYYCRLNTADLTQTSVKIGLQPYEYAFPCIAPFTTSVTDKSVLIGFLRTSSTIYPEMRMINIDNDMNYSESKIVKEGKSYADFLQGSPERWGDYTGISRRNTPNGPEVWISGCYGEKNDNGGNNILSTWIAQITDGSVAAAPVANFSADHTVVMAGQTVQFNDLSSNNPTNWSWTFPGGTPSTSNQQNPIVTYNDAGIYDVKLTSTNAIGADEELKTGFINVTQHAQAPIADFTSDATEVNIGGTVQFEDLSSNTPTKWQWFFPGGTPSLSGLQNPVIVYIEPGCHNVTLDVTNAAGEDVTTKTCYIDVMSTAVTESGSPFSKFIVYPNPVSNGRLNIEFKFEHSTELDFVVIDERGNIVRDLLHRVMKGGLNNLSFNTDPLIPGSYFLIVHDKNNAILKSEKFIIL